MKTKYFCLGLVFSLFCSGLSAKQKQEVDLLLSLTLVGTWLKWYDPFFWKEILSTQYGNNIKQLAVSEHYLRVPNELSPWHDRNARLWGKLFFEQFQPPRMTVISMPLSKSLPDGSFQVGDQWYSLRVPSEGTDKRKELVRLLTLTETRGVSHWKVAARKLGLSNSQIDFLTSSGDPAELLLGHFENRYPRGAASILYACFLSINRRLLNLLMMPVQTGTREQLEQVGTCGVDRAVLRPEVCHAGLSEPVNTQLLLDTFPFYSSPDYEMIVLLIWSNPSQSQCWQAVARRAGLTARMIERLRESNPQKVVNAIMYYLAKKSSNREEALERLMDALSVLEGSDVFEYLKIWNKPK